MSDYRIAAPQNAVVGAGFRFIAHRLLTGAIALALLITFIFFAINLLPGDAAQMILGRDATPDAVASLRHALGLDVPAYVRFATWSTNLLHGDLGESIASGRSVASLVFVRFGNTVFLAATAAVIAVPLALFLGITAALFRNSLFDRLSSVVTLSIVSFPDFFVAYTLILFLSIQLHLFPAIASISPTTPFWDRLYDTLLPAFTLVLFVVTHMMRMTRAAIIDVLSQPYIEMAQIKGMQPLFIILRHALPNAWAPIINVVVFNLAFLITGVVIIEVVFAYPGLGQLLVDSVTKRDIPVVQACCLVFGVLYIFLNLIADILAILANPRLRRVHVL